MAGRSSFHSVKFYIMGDDDVAREAHGVTTNKSLFAEGVPVENGLYNPHYGTTELSWNCQTCFNNKMLDPGHQGMATMNYPLQNPLFRKEIIKWLKIVCHKCGEFVIKRDLPASIADHNKLGEFLKLVRAGNEKQRLCAHCGAAHPWISKDAVRQNVIWREFFQKGTKKSERKEIMYNNEIQTVLSRISNANVLKMGKKLDSHPSKLIVKNIVVSSTVIRPEIRKISGNRSTMADITGHLRNIMELNGQVPKDIPENVDADLHAKLVLVDLTLFEMIQGSGTTSNTMRLVTNTNKIANSIASRLPKKQGRLRANLMGKRTTKMMRSVITGDKALRPDQVGVPKIIAKNLWIPETVRPWNRDRLMGYYLNGTKTYPGCQKIKRADTGHEYYVDKLTKDYVLQDGDIVYRNVIDGDSLGFNREPSLLFCSIAVLVVKIINGLTLRINSSICALFNADFDGDEMNGLLVKNVESVAEVKLTSGINQWFISYKNSKPTLGLFQDAIIGAYEMTHDDVNIDKFHAMNMCNRTSTNHELVFDKKTYNSRELISMFMPSINYEGRAEFYVPEFAPYIKYKPSETNVVIKRGKLESGVLDKSSVGQESEGGIFHTIYAEHGAAEAIDCIYNLQQLINGFIYYCGITFGLKDVYLTKNTRSRIDIETGKIIKASEDIARQLDEGKLVPPIGMTLNDYYEELQMAALDHGDEFIRPIMEEIDPNENWLYKFIFSGSKGKRTNLLAIYTSIGSIGIKGRRIKQSLNGRTSINFQRFSTDPISRGYNSSNFIRGIRPITFPFAAMEARYELIEIALSTALAGTMNRNAVKNLESILVSNQRGSIKQNRLVQLLYGETGFDTRKIEKTVFPTIKLSDADFTAKYRTDVKSLDAIWHNSTVEKALKGEFDKLTIERNQYRDLFLKFEGFSRRNFLMKDSLRMPVNVARIINNVVHMFPNKKRTLDPLKAIALVDEYCDSLGYVYMNEIQRKAKKPIPKHIQNAVTLLRILIRSNLCTSNLLRNNIDIEMLDMIFQRITYKITESMIEYGCSVGIIAAQSMSEPITQFLLDAKHRAGLKKAKTNTVDRFDELLKVKPTSEMDAPSMLLIPHAEFSNDRQRVVEIANHIEMLSFRRFINSTKVFIEDFGAPEHPLFASEKKMIDSFSAYNFGDQVPKDLINWCIRFTIVEEELVLKSMKRKTIFLKLMSQFPWLYIVYSPPSDSNIVMRVYIRNSAFKRGSDINAEAIIAIAQQIKDTIIRGISGLRSTNVVSIAHSYIKPDGSMDVKKMFGIETDGTNLTNVLENPFLNSYECNTSSITEFEEMYGIEAARNKVLDELLNTLKDASSYEHASIYADEMSYSGRLTSVQRSGLGKRELDAVLARASFGSPVQVLQAAAINSQHDQLFGMSAPMVMGTVPRFGTTFNDICINEKMIRENVKSNDEVFSAL